MVKLNYRFDWAGPVVANNEIDPVRQTKAPASPGAFFVA
jgi:hypothetical protein